MVTHHKRPCEEPDQFLSAKSSAEFQRHFEALTVESNFVERIKAIYEYLRYIRSQDTSEQPKTAFVHAHRAPQPVLVGVCARGASVFLVADRQIEQLAGFLGAYGTAPYPQRSMRGKQDSSEETEE